MLRFLAEISKLAAGFIEYPKQDILVEKRQRRSLRYFSIYATSLQT